MKILVAEKDVSLSNTLVEKLKNSGYIVDSVYDGLDGVDYVAQRNYDVVLLDTTLPEINGILILKEMREEGDVTPVILLSEKSSQQDKIYGLDLGADDYITKPFVMDELLARIRSVLRRRKQRLSEELIFNDLVLNINAMSISTKYGSIKSSKREFQILKMFVTRPNQIITKEQFLENVWGYDFDGDSNSVEVYISYLRKKLIVIKAKVMIITKHGVGYALTTIGD